MLCLVLAAMGCEPTPEQVQKAIEKDPKIVWTAIKKDPVGFFQAAESAKKDYEKFRMEEEEKAVLAQREKQFKNPLKPVIEEDRVAFGPKDAKITIVEYSDFECPYCRDAYASVKEVMGMYPNDVKVVFKHLPLPHHKKAMLGARYYEAFARQKPELAQQFHDAIFENQESKFIPEGEVYLKTLAKSLGADLKKLEKDANDETILARIKGDMQEAYGFELTGTPGFIVNGVSVKGAQRPQVFKQLIDRHLGTTIQ